MYCIICAERGFPAAAENTFHLVICDADAQGLPRGRRKYSYYMSLMVHGSLARELPRG